MEERDVDHRPHACDHLCSDCWAMLVRGDKHSSGLIGNRLQHPPHLPCSMRAAELQHMHGCSRRVGNYSTETIKRTQRIHTIRDEDEGSYRSGLYREDLGDIVHARCAVVFERLDALDGLWHGEVGRHLVDGFAEGPEGNLRVQLLLLEQLLHRNQRLQDGLLVGLVQAIRRVDDDAQLGRIHHVHEACASPLFEGGLLHVGRTILHEREIQLLRGKLGRDVGAEVLRVLLANSVGG
mmetsp:Transcript_19006/g.73198  ORF Transcript_19006/g.73198 Transcript_19006/m.73198 type:complete len:237 (-) Transcript_19006:493-1203(-)